MTPLEYYIACNEPPKKDKDYPQWVCCSCAEANGGKFPQGHTATFHMDTCGWCNQWKAVTEPRDYRYPTHKELVSG